MLEASPNLASSRSLCSFNPVPLALGCHRHSDKTQEGDYQRGTRRGSIPPNGLELSRTRVYHLAQQCKTRPITKTGDKRGLDQRVGFSEWLAIQDTWGILLSASRLQVCDLGGGACLHTVSNIAGTTYIVV